MTDGRKREYGQYFTKENPFLLRPFREWLDGLALPKGALWIEPFAGENNLVSMMRAVPGYEGARWVSYDVDPPELNSAPDVPVSKVDTINSFPCHADMAITNPPYLAKNSATRRGLEYAGAPYDDLYKKCLEVMLANCDHVAAIIPESFLTADLFHARLDVVISLAMRMFDDTDCPVCLACFDSKDTGDDFEVYANEERIGAYSDLLSAAEGIRSDHRKGLWMFNDPAGSIGVRCVDGTGTLRLGFMDGDEVAPDKIKVTSRALTRVSGCPAEYAPDDVIEVANELLSRYREETHDVLLTSFKGLRKDGRYRRRLDFACARGLLCAAVERMDRERGGSQSFQ